MDHSEELRQVIRRKNTAYGAGDIAGYLAAYAPNATIFDRVPITFDELRSLMASQFADGKTLEYQIADDDPIRFTESGDAAMVCYPWREKFRYGDGRTTDTEYYETNVWHRRNGQWKMENGACPPQRGQRAPHRRVNGMSTVWSLSGKSGPRASRAY